LTNRLSILFGWVSSLSSTKFAHKIGESFQKTRIGRQGGSQHLALGRPPGRQPRPGPERWSSESNHHDLPTTQNPCWPTRWPAD